MIRVEAWCYYAAVHTSACAHEHVRGICTSFVSQWTDGVCASHVSQAKYMVRVSKYHYG